MFQSRENLKTILYIEDDAGLARLLQKRLSRLGFKVDITENGEGGLNLLQSNTYDVVLIDYNLPGMSGIEILRRLAPDEFSPPFILLTAAGDEKIAVEALQLGAADYIVKDSGQVYLDLLPAVMSAAYTRVQLARENREQQAQLFHYAEQLRRSEERLHRAMEGSGTGVWDWDLLTGAMHWSDNLRHAMHLPKEGIPSIEHWKHRIHPEDRKKFEEAIQEHLQGNAPVFNSLYREQSEAGSGQPETWNWSLVRGVALNDKQGKPYRMVGTHTDFTSFKQLEEELEIAKNKAEAASQAKSEFLAMMSHEIRTPMNAVMGLANILAQTPLADKQKEIVHTLQSSANALLRLINDVLDISRIEANQVTFEQAPFSLKELISDIRNIIRIQALAKGLEFIVDDKGIDGKIFIGDRTRLHQIIVNLCSNAVKFTDRGSVSLIAKAQATGENNAFAVAIEVKDSGIGIPLEKQNMIFDKFVQADQSITRRFGGTGLGLSISRSLAMLMGGEITVASTPGQGSVFTLHVTLPLAEEVPIVSIQSPANVPLPDAKPQLVLLVEDYPANIIVAGLMLESLNYRYDVARNGHEALEQVRNTTEPYSAILMDVQMQGMDGFETTRHIRDLEKTSGGSAHYIIGVTAHAMPGDRERCLASGMDEYITKPINLDELAAKLDIAARY